MKRIIVILGILLMASGIGCSKQSNLSKGVTELKQSQSVPLSSPVWSPSGEELATSHISYSDYQSTIYIIDLKTNQHTPLITVDGEAVVHSWSPNGQNIALSILNSNKFSDGIWIFNITDKSNYFVGIGEATTWSPDGKLLAIYSCVQLPDGNSTTATIRLVNLLNGKEEILFSQNSCLKLAYMSWSSDKKNIAFSFSRDNTNEEHLDQIFVLDVSTKKTGKLLDKGKWSPSYSPNGEYVIFVENYALKITDNVGICQVVVRDLGIDIIGDVSWSPDGTKWAVSGLGHIYVIDIGKIMGEDFFQKPSICQ